MKEIQRIDCVPGMARIVKYNGVAYFTGHSARPGYKTLREQTVAVLERYDELFKIYNLSKENILVMNAYVADIKMIDEFNEELKKWLGDVYPAGVAVEAKPMGDDNLLELQFFVAYKD